MPYNTYEGLPSNLGILWTKSYFLSTISHSSKNVSQPCKLLHICEENTRIWETTDFFMKSSVSACLFLCDEGCTSGEQLDYWEDSGWWKRVPFEAGEWVKGTNKCFSVWSGFTLAKSSIRISWQKVTIKETIKILGNQPINSETTDFRSDKFRIRTGSSHLGNFT